MKNLLLSFFFVSLVFSGFSQVVTGVYKGKMEVDSPKYTVDFELTLKEKNGKLVGYCQRLFIVEDILYYNLVKVTARIADSVLIVEDDKSVSNNFKEKTSGVKTVMFFKIQKDNDTVSVMPGEWSTSRTKKFLPITGSVSVYREQNYLATQLYKRLEDQRLDKEMLFEEKPKPVLVSTTPKPQPTDVASATTQTKDTTTSKPPVLTTPDNKQTTANNKPTVSTVKDTISNTSVAVNKPSDNKQPNGATTKPAEQKPTGNNPTNPPVVVSNKPITTVVKDTVNNTSVAKNNQQPVTQQTTAAANQQGSKPPVTKPVTTGNKPSVVSTNKDSVNKQTVAVNNAKPQTGNPPVVQPITKPAEQKPTTGNTTTPVTDPTINPFGQVTTGNASAQPTATGEPPVINNPIIVKRQVEVIEALEVTEDSVVLSLYDNGEIDGDTVSVFLNNELLVSKVGLKASAFKKTIAVAKGEVLQLTLFAENLGSIPPNTGLLVITTGNERYQVHFSATLNKSSSIMIRRKE
ncbi:MAG: hypothetical protein GXC73_06515 [Chitinophagaceae bacterium]|nr:hypothetical protein [Chitinophagaceae bacterium]